LAARLPLFDWGLISAQVDQQAARASWSRNQFELEKQKTLADLLEIHAHAAAQLADRERLQELLPDLQQTALASIDRYKTGGSGILETTDAINLWVQTLLNERLAYYTYLMDLAQLKRLTGAEP
jgi:outer membrane protein TolC